MKKPEAEKLADLLLDELRHPGDVQQVIDQVGERLEDARAVADFLTAKDRQHREVFYLQAQERWFRIFGWTLAKALMLCGLLMAGFYFLARNRLPADYIVMAIFGASFYYLVIYVLSLRRHARNARQVEAIRERYRAELREILKDLVEAHRLDAKYLPSENREQPQGARSA